MRRIAILFVSALMCVFTCGLMFAGVATPAPATRRMTVEQLEQALRAVQGKRDGKIAEMLTGVELNERLTPDLLSRWEAKLPGEKSRRSLLVIADKAAFLDPPAKEIPVLPEPDFAVQSRIMAMAVEYTTKTITKLPNFFARRDTVFYEDDPPQVLENMARTLIPYQPMHQVNRSVETVLYRDGKEVVDAANPKRMKYDPKAATLTTHGVFGPILSNTLVDAANGTVNWSHWEQGPSGPVAVFHFSVPQEKSHYQVEFCCFLEGPGQKNVFKKVPAYHGEIAVDPNDGTIFRLSLVADLDPVDPVGISNILVEYASVEIGGKSYICPVRSVSMWVAGGVFADSHQVLLNDVDFAQYHLFRSESRVLFGNEPITP